jgi:transketolase
MRAAFSESLVRLAKADSKLLLLTGDHGYGLFDNFRRECPSQYINAGVAEQNMVGMAAGLAQTGFRPIVYGLSAFVPVRVLEQIKLDIAHDQLPVILIGDGAGFVYSHFGSSHQSTEDIACTRAIPGLSVYSPADRFEVRLCLELAYQSKRPVYMRLGKADLDSVHNRTPQVTIGTMLKVRQGKTGGLSFIATGSMVRTAVGVATSRYPQANVWSAPFIKPMNKQQVTDICQQSHAVIVLEEHSVFGGLGSAITEISAATAPVHLLRIGVADRFSERCGSYDYLLREHKLDQESVAQQIEAFVNTL